MTFGETCKNNLVTNGVSLLQTNLGHREGHEARRMGLEAMPLDQDIQGGHGERRQATGPKPKPRWMLLPGLL